MRSMFAALLLASPLACVSVSPTEAVIARVNRVGSGSELVWCRLHLGWTEGQLRAACGEPVEEVARRGQVEQRCLIYATDAVALATVFSSSEPKYFAACLEVGRGTRNKLFGQEAWRVAEVIGLARTSTQ